MGSDPVANVLDDPELAADIAGMLGATFGVPIEGAPQPAAGPPAASSAGRGAARAVASADAAAPGLQQLVARAGPLVRAIGRPALAVRNGSFELPVAPTWQARLVPTKTRIDAACEAVGHVVVDGDAASVGAAWLIAPGVVATTRQVALRFVRLGTRGRPLIGRGPTGRSLRPRVEFGDGAGLVEAFAGVADVARLAASDGAELGGPVRATVTGVLYLAPLTDTAPDLALLAVSSSSAARPLPAPLPLYAADPTERQLVALVGYARTGQGGWGTVPDGSLASWPQPKRLAPGRVGALVDHGCFSHDCAGIVSSAGAPLIDLATGAVVGLDLGGDNLDERYALGAPAVHRVLRRAGLASEVTLALPVPPAPDAAAATATTAAAATSTRRRGVAAAVTDDTGADDTGAALARADAADLAVRDGYREDFLGAGPLAVRLPTLAATLGAQAVEVDPQAAGTARFALRYRHFSIVMHRTRRLAIFTATNIDGDQAVAIKRAGDPWAYDPRLPRASQVGPELYRDNDFDRGHLTRRIDPAWGPDAAQAEADTFFYTNATPQHVQFNQHLWEELESYILSSATTLGFAATVFTGPVFTADDRLYRGVAIPNAYWKVVAMVNADTGALSATAYRVSQADLVSRAQFTFGQFKTYQVAIRSVERATGLDFGPLRRADPFAAGGGRPARELLRLADVTLAPPARTKAQRSTTTVPPRGRRAPASARKPPT